MYDISGLSEENLVEDLKADWQQVILNDLDITSSRHTQRIMADLLYVCGVWEYAKVLENSIPN